MARILAKCLNCAQGPTTTPDGTCHACSAIAAGTSLDVVEMDAASQRGIDDIREIRDRVVLQPVEGRYKVYILDEAHQLTDAAWNALLKLIEEPPPHLVFVFCTTDLSKVLPTVRSRCQTFVFQRPRLQDLVTVLRASPTREGDRRARPGARARRARRARRVPRRRLDARPARVLDREQGHGAGRCCELLGTVEEEALFRLCDLVIDRDTAGALTFIEELSERGHDLGRLVIGPARAPAPADARAAPRRGSRGAAGDRGDARAAARAGEPDRRGDGAAPDRPARGRGRRHAPGRRPAPAARARAREGDAARGGSLARVGRVPARAARARGPASSAASPAVVPQRPRCASGRGARPPRGCASAAPNIALEQLQEAWARTVAAGGRGARRIPTASVLARGASRRPQRRHADARVPADGAVPTRQLARGSEERDAARATRSTT